MIDPQKPNPCFLVQEFPPIVNLAKYGDLVCLLPALKWVHDNTGRKPRVVVSEKFANIFDGVSYVEPVPVQYEWPKGTTEAKHWAVKEFGSCIVPQFWNDRDTTVSPPLGRTQISLNGKIWNVDQNVWPNYMAAMWGVLGFSKEDMRKMPLVFDQRDMQRERELVDRYLSKTKPTILVNFKSGSAPFPYEPELMKAIRSKTIDIVDLQQVKAHRVYDLIGLMDAAAGVITVSTATLHLAAASRTPYIALTEDSWSHAEPKGNVALNIKYAQAKNRVNEIVTKVRQWTEGYTTVESLKSDSAPSILKQTHWRCGFFDFSHSNMPQKPGIDHFNCTAVTRPDGDWLIVRRSAFQRGQVWGMNTCVAFLLDGVRPTKAVTIQMPRTSAEEHFEDPRAVYHDDKTLVSCTNFIWGKKITHTHQIAVWCDENWKGVQRLDPIMGFNGPTVLTNSGNEKNWLWFFYDNKPHMIYHTFPHKVVRFNEKYVVEHIYEMSPYNFHWPLGQPRGGTPPVLIGDEYWSFFHSSDDSLRHKKRKYYMGAYSFEARPPFAMKRFIREPLLVGSSEDRNGPGKPLVVFPCGALLRNEKWFVTFGVNDLDSAWIEIPHEELERLTYRLPHSVDLRQTKVVC